MNKEDYVSLEVAKLLKEKGFDEPCDWIYDTKEQCFKNSKEVNFDVTFTNSILRDNVYCVPTLYEAQKWLRQKHNIHLDVRCTAYCKPLNRCDYLCEIFSLSDGKYSDTNIYHKYDDCLNEGILETLKLV